MSDWVLVGNYSITDSLNKFSTKKSLKCLLIREKYVSLHPLKRNNGRVAQLNRVADYGSAGYRFESCRDHQNPLHFCRGFCIFPHFIEENRHQERYFKPTAWLHSINRMFFSNTSILIFKHQKVYLWTLGRLEFHSKKNLHHTRIN